MSASPISQGELLIVDKRHSAAEMPPPIAADMTPMAMLKIAVSQNADLEKLRQLMDLHERWEKDQARKAFVGAMSEFKANCITVVKDKDNSQYGSKYVSLGNLISTVTPYLSRSGLSVRWDIDQSSDKIKVACIITHVMGHSESVSMACPPDKSGAKNPIQEIKSAITYAKACTFESICGLASTDANVDDDGNGADAQWVDEYVDAIKGATTREEVDKIFREAYQKASAAKDKNAQQAFIQAKDARKKAL